MTTTRRGALSTVAAIGSALMAPRLPAAQAARKHAGMGAGLLHPRKTIDVAVASICFDGFGDEDFQLTFENAPKLGIPNIEFNVWHPRNLTPRGLASIQERCRRHRLRPVSLQATGWVGDSAELTREVSRVLWLIEACKRLGCRIIKCTGAKRDTRGGVDGIIALMKEVAPAAEEAGVLLTLENHFGNNLEFPEDYQRIFAAIDSKAVGMCLDPAHFSASGVDLAALVDSFHQRIYHVDLKDNEKQGAHKAVPFGTGIVKLDQMVEHLLARGYRGYLVVELARKEGGITVEQLAAGKVLARKYER